MEHNIINDVMWLKNLIVIKDNQNNEQWLPALSLPWLNIFYIFTWIY